MTLAVGLDIGNQRCVVAVSRNSVVHSILNEDSKRETPAVIQFADKHPLFGSAAASTVSQLKRLVREGREERGYSAVQLLAMLLAHVRRSAEATTQSLLSDCVIGIPSNFDERQRTTYLEAARVAGWNPLALLDEGAAIALEYRNERPECTGVVAFVDIGHSDTQISVMSFEGGGNNSISVVAKASDPDLGGRDFDEIIFDRFSRKFEAEHRMVVSSNTKATGRLRMACEKAKKVLCTSTVAHLSVDSLMEDRDAKGVITRVEFESMSSHLVRRIGDLFAKALEDVRLRGYNVHSVELVASGSRIPAISRRLAEIYERETSRTLNGRASVARGCALLCEQLNFAQGNLSTMIESFGIPSSEYTLPSDASDLSKLEDVESKLAKKDREYESAGSSKNKLVAFVHEEGKKVVIKMPMAVSWLTNEFTSGVIASEDISSILKKEKQLAKWDQDHHSRSAQRNSLESYIYRKRNELSRKSESSTKECAEISQVLQEAEDWLYEEDNRDGDSYKTKLSEIRISIRSVKGAASLENPADPLSQHNPCRLVGEGKRNQETAVENASAGSNSELMPKSYTEGMGTRVDAPTTRKEKKHKAENNTETAQSAPTSQFKGVAADENQKMMRQPTTKSDHRSRSVHNPIEHHTSNDSNSPRATVDRNKKFNTARFNDLRLSPSAGADSISTSNQLQSRRKRSVGRIFKTILETSGIRRKGESNSEGFIPGISTTYTSTNDPKV